MSSIEIHEFTRGFRNIHSKNGILVSGGYEKEVGPNNHPVPEVIKTAVEKSCFRINDSYSHEIGEFALIARDIDNYSVLAVANSVPEDGSRPVIAYRYFWLEKPTNIQIDGIGTLLYWWQGIREECFILENYEKFNRHDYYAKIYKTTEFYNFRPQVENLISQVSSYPFVYTIKDQNERTIQYTAWHYLTLQNPEENNQLAWAWNVPSLEYPEDFSLIYCADSQSCERILKSIKQFRSKEIIIHGQSQSPQKFLPSSSNTTGKLIGETNNTFLNKVKRSIKDLSTAEKPKEIKFVELIHCLEVDDYPIESWTWEDIIDKTILNHNNDSTAKYRALLALLNPAEEFLAWLNILQNKSEYRNTSFNIQKELLEITSSNSLKAKNYFEKNINACINNLLCESKSSSTNSVHSIAELLLIQSNSIWVSYFDKYAKKLLPKLIKRQPDENDIFYTEVLQSWGQWQYVYEHTKSFQKFPEYKFLANLFEKKKKYSLSSFFYQLSEGSVPVDIARNSEADFFFPVKIDSQNKSGLQDSKKKFSLPPSFPDLASWNNGLLNLLVPLVVALIVVAFFVPPNFLKNIFETILPKQLHVHSRNPVGVTNHSDNSEVPFVETWNQWKQTGDTQLKQRIIQDLQSNNQAKVQEISEFLRKNLALPVKISFQPNTRDKDIKTVQEILKIIGYYQGDIDGGLGYETKSAFNQFKKNKTITPTQEINQETVKPLLDYFINEQVKLVKGLLLSSFQTRPNDEEIKKDIQDLQKCRTDAATSLLKYKPCIDKSGLIPENS